jgi:polyribonucleotide 5'-hydroxyl-kinase
MHSEEETKKFILPVENELRFEGDLGNYISVTLTEGRAELFGTELAKNKEYILQGVKAGVFTWHGCKLEVKGKLAMSYTSDTTPMLEYINTHMALEKMREQSKVSNLPGPRVVVVGGEDVGKTTLCRILLNYAVRRFYKPLFIDLDVSLNDVGLPGTIGSLLMERPVDIEAGFPIVSPLLFHFGRLSPLENLVLYKHLLTRLSQSVQKRCEADQDIRSSGFVVNTCSWVDGTVQEVLLHAIECFHADIVCVLDNERLYQTLKQKYSKEKSIVRLSKSGGTVSRSAAYRQSLRDLRVKKYFYGFNNHLYPNSTVLKFSDFKLYKIGVPPIPLSCLPIGEKIESCETKLSSLKFSEDLTHVLLSVCNSDGDSEEHPVIDTSILGFLYVTAVDMARKHVTVLSPAPGPIPKNILLLSNFKVNLE